MDECKYNIIMYLLYVHYMYVYSTYVCTVHWYVLYSMSLGLCQLWVYTLYIIVPAGDNTLKGKRYSDAGRTNSAAIEEYYSPEQYSERYIYTEKIIL